MSSASPKPSPLGRGLSALLGDVDASYQGAARATDKTAGPKPGGMQRLPVSWLRSGTFQPRRHFDDEALKELADSIKGRGVLEPLLVRPVAGERDAYEIIAGERRWRASQIAGLHEVPVLVRELSDREAMEFGIIENVQREDLSPIEEADGYKRLIEEFGHTQDALGKIVGKSRPHIANMLRLLSLPEEIRQMIAEGKLTTGHARALIPTKEPVKLAREIVKKGLNVRQAETLAKRNQDNPQVHKKKEATAQNADIIALEKDVERAIGLKVKIANKGNAGAFTLFYTDLEQLDGVLKKLMA